MWAQNNNNNNGFGFDLNRQLRGATFYFTLPVVSETTTELRTEEKEEAKVINDQRQL
jgi:hypothetical protein